MEDAQIIALYWSRSQEAVAETAEKYGPFLTCLSYHIVHSRHDAEECVNDAYLHAWNAIPPERPAAFRAWLGRVTRNLSLDRWKRDHAQKRGGGNMALLLGELTDCLPATQAPEQALAEQELGVLISRFLQRQQPGARYMFLRRYWYGDPLADIAQSLGCGEARVKSSLFRTRRALRRELEREGVAL